jgi:predicted Zn-dependent protease
MAYMFERLSNMNRLAGQRLPEFLLTHPVTQSRISDSYNQTRQYEDTDFPLNLDYQLMRVRILMSDEASPEISVKRMRDGLNTDDPTIRMAYQYGLVLALSRTTKIDESMELLRPLIKQYPEKIAFVLAQAEIEMAAQRYENAIDLLQTKLKISPDNFPLSMQYADALLKADKVLEAQRVLERQVALRPNDADIWYLLAETHGLAKDIAAVHQARAEYFMLNGNLDQAIKHLNYALPLVGDNFQMIARIKQRLQDFHLMQQEKL